jgi:hypothetical protein
VHFRCGLTRTNQCTIEKYTFIYLYIYTYINKPLHMFRRNESSSSGGHWCEVDTSIRVWTSHQWPHIHLQMLVWTSHQWPPEDDDCFCRNICRALFIKVNIYVKMVCCLVCVNPLGNLNLLVTYNEMENIALRIRMTPEMKKNFP